jgi:hypothetical protein
LDVDAKQAELDRLPVDQIDGLLADLRSGDEATSAAAEKHLLHAMRYVAYRGFSRIEQWFRAERVVGTMFIDMGTAIERLRRNEISAVQLEGHLCGYLEHSAAHYRAECSRGIPPPASTNSERNKRGVAPHVGLTRTTLRGQQDEDGDKVIRKLGDEIPVDVVSPDGGVHQPCGYAERYRLADELWEVTDNAIEVEFVTLLTSGNSLKQVSQIMGVTLGRAKQIRNRLTRRVRR